MSLLSEILSSKVRAEVFRLLFGLNLDARHVRDIQRRSGFAIGTIQTELKKLHKLDLVLKEKDGNRLYYRANQAHPIYDEINALVVKTVGLADVLKGALMDAKAIRLAFVFGSAAQGGETAKSDIDLMVVGDLGLRQLTPCIRGLPDKLGREINPYVLPANDLKSRIDANDHFISQVLNGPKLFIIGSENDLNAMV